MIGPKKPHSLLCEVCSNCVKGECKIENLLTQTERPLEEYLGICEGFTTGRTPITPIEFKKLMDEIKKKTAPDPASVGPEAYANRRYNMENLMCQVLRQHGYGAGVKVFIDEHFEYPF